MSEIVVADESKIKEGFTIVEILEDLERITCASSDYILDEYFRSFKRGSERLWG